MRVGLRGMVRRVWGRRGVKVVQRVQLAYRWMYLFLVVDGRRGRLSWTWIDSMRSEAIASAVRGLRMQTDMGALVWDGARGHRAEEVQRVGLPTIVQPPYSPELNPAERVLRRFADGWRAGSTGASRTRWRLSTRTFGSWNRTPLVCARSPVGPGSTTTSGDSSHI